MISGYDLDNICHEFEELKEQCEDEVYDFLGGEENENLKNVYISGHHLHIENRKEIPLKILSELEKEGFLFQLCTKRVEFCAKGENSYFEYVFRW